MHVTIPVSPGELIDKITVLEIKSEEITDEAKLVNVRRELSLLMEVVGTLPQSTELTEYWGSLRTVNKRIWDSENDVREFWNDDAKFLAGARTTHFQNDERARIKRAINDLLGSSIREEKSHPAYEHKG
jgi:hypothetical protein